jgi:drug/metabolite transporter (DMT)-like permease
MIAAIALAIPLLIVKRSLWANFKEGLVLGFFIWILYLAQTIGLVYTSAANSGLITGLFVAFVPIFSITVFRKMPSLTGVIATIVSVTGLYILTGGLTHINIGDIITLISAMAYAIHILFADRYVKKGIDPYVLSFQQFFFVGAASLLASLIFNLPFTVASSEVLWMIIFLAIFPSLTAFAIQLVAQKYVSPVRVSLILAFEPVFAVIFAWTLGHEAYSINKAIGGFLIFIALILSGIPSRPVFKENKKLRN